MVGIPKGGVRLALAAALAMTTMTAQTTLSLQQAGERDPSANFAPKLLNQTVIVRGTVNASAYHFPDHSLLAMEDGSYGTVLKVARGDVQLDAYRPGDELEVQGTVAAFIGMAVIEPARIVKLAAKPAPPPVEVPLGKLIGLRYLGRLVRVE